MTREDLEREIVVKDKQAIITDCLKLYDVNDKLLVEISGLQMELKAERAVTAGQKDRIYILEQRTWWGILSTWIEKRRDAKRVKNEQYKAARKK